LRHRSLDVTGEWAIASRQTISHELTKRVFEPLGLPERNLVAIEVGWKDAV
jgi:hypothetical protein